MTHEPGSAARPRVRSLSALLSAVLCLALAAALAVLVVRAVAARDTERPPGGGYGSEAERSELLSLTEQFALRMGTYGPEDLDEKGAMPGYRKRVGELLTTKFRTSFEQSVELAEKSVEQAKVEVKAKVNGMGVASVDEDRASTLIAWETTARYGDGEFSDPRQVRSRVSLVKTGGEWLVDDFTPVTGEVQ